MAVAVAPCSTSANADVCFRITSLPGVLLAAAIPAKILDCEEASDRTEAFEGEAGARLDAPPRPFAASNESAMAGATGLTAGQTSHALEAQLGSPHGHRVHAWVGSMTVLLPASRFGPISAARNLCVLRNYSHSNRDCCSSPCTSGT